MGVWLLNFTPVPYTSEQRFCIFFEYSEWSKNGLHKKPSFVGPSSVIRTIFRHSSTYTTIAKFYYFWNVPSIKKSDPSHLFQFRKYSTILHWLEASQKSTNPYPRFIFSLILYLHTEGSYLTVCFTSQGTINTTSPPRSFTRGYATPPPSLFYFLNRFVADSDDFDANADEKEVRMEVSSLFVGWGRACCWSGRCRSL